MSRTSVEVGLLVWLGGDVYDGENPAELIMRLNLNTIVLRQSYQKSVILSER